MEQPKGCEAANKRKHFVCEVEKSIFDLPQSSSRNLNKEVNEKLTKMGMIRSEFDRCIYYNEAKTTIIGVHVDDSIIDGNSEDVTYFKKEFKNHYAVKDLGEASNIHSIKCIREDPSTILIQQRDYIREVLTNQNLAESKGLSTPLTLNFRQKIPRR